MSFSSDTIWPLRLDLGPIECQQTLREKETNCYSDVVSVFRAQGPLSEEKKLVLNHLQKILNISDERNKYEFRRAASDEELLSIAAIVSGFDAYSEWAYFGSQKIPHTLRPVPRTSYCDQTTQTVAEKYDEEKLFVPPVSTIDMELTEKLEDSISRNRLFKSRPSPCTTSSVAINTESMKSTPKKEGVTSLEYNLHLLSEIATGESTQSGSATETSDIKPDCFSIQNQIDDIELPYSETESMLTNQYRFSSNSHLTMTTASSNAYMSTSTKSLSTMGHESSSSNLSCNTSTSIGQRYVVPRNTITQGINLIASNTQRHQTPAYIGQHQQQQPPQSGTYLALANNQIRSPPSHQISSTWPVQQQVYIQNVSSHHGLGLQHNLGHQSMDNLTSLGFTLQQRAVRAEQHQPNNKQNLIVRNLGSQPTMDPDRNKRYMVVKGGTNMGPSNKKPKISNPSNRQPGRPPLMPAPSSAYTSRPYVANEIFHSNRTSNSATSAMSSDSSSMGDLNGLKISSVISSGNGSNNGRSVPVNSSQVRSNSYYSVSRGNGMQRSNFDTNTGSVVQLGGGSHLRTIDTPGGGNSVNTLRPKNIQPVISVVPLSPRGQTGSDNNTASNISIVSSVKEENLEHQMMPVKIINKSEMYANLLDRINSPARHSINQSDNKTKQHDLNIGDIS